jgi:hypothetical protein
MFSPIVRRILICTLVVIPALLVSIVTLWMDVFGQLPRMGFMTVWLGLILGFVLIAMLLVADYLKRTDRGRFSGRPRRALAGKHWGVPAPHLFIPGAFVALPLVSGFALWRGYSWKAIVPILLCALVVAPEYWRVRRTLRAQRKSVSERPMQMDADLLAAFLPNVNAASVPAAAVLDPLDAVAQRFKISANQLRPTDRFIEALGTASVLDDTIDGLAGALLRSQAPPRWLDLDAIRTLRDYVLAWNRLRGRTMTASNPPGEADTRAEEAC